MPKIEHVLMAHESFMRRLYGGGGSETNPKFKRVKRLEKVTSIEFEKLSFGRVLPEYKFVDCFEFDSGNFIVVSKGDGHSIANYDGLGHSGNKVVQPIHFMDVKSGQVKTIQNKLLFVASDSFYADEGGKLQKYSGVTGEKIASHSSIPSHVDSIIHLRKIPGSNHMIHFKSSATNFSPILILDGDTLTRVKEVNTSNFYFSDRGQMYGAELFIDKDFLLIQWKYRNNNGSVSSFNSDLHGLSIVLMEDVIGETARPRVIHLGYSVPSIDMTKILSASFLGFGEESLFFQFGCFERDPLRPGGSGTAIGWDPLRFAASIGRNHLKELIKSAGDQNKFDGTNIRSIIDNLSGEEEYLFGYAWSDENYIDGAPGGGPTAITPFGDRPKYLGDFPPYHQMGFLKSKTIGKFINSGALTRSYLDMRISCVNPYFPVYRRPVSRYGKFQFAHHMIDGFSSKLGGGNYFVEQTPFLLEPIPLFDRETIKIYLKDYVDDERTLPNNVDGTKSSSNLYCNPSHVTPTHLHLFDAEKYTKYKLIFE